MGARINKSKLFTSFYLIFYNTPRITENLYSKYVLFTKICALAYMRIIFFVQPPVCTLYSCDPYTFSTSFRIVFRTW
jgi:hypothetical protein